MDTSSIDTNLDSWSDSMLQDQYPVYVTEAVMLGISLLRQDFSPLEVFMHGIISLLGLLFSRKVAAVRSRRGKYAMVFVYYQMIQCLNVYLAVVNPSLSVVYIISSTVLLIRSEVTPAYGTVVNLLFFAKHIGMWQYWVLRSGQALQMSSEAFLSVVWLIYQIWNFVKSKEDAMLSVFNSYQQAKQEKDRLNALLQAIPDGVVVLTKDKKIFTFNKVLLKLLGIDEKEEYLERKILEVIEGLAYAKGYKETKSSNVRLMDDILEVISSKLEASVDFGIVRLDETYLKWRGNFEIWDQTNCCILTVRDDRGLVYMKTLANKESESKSALLRSVSHELRTPINAIVNLTRELLEVEELTDQGKANCTMLISSSNFLLSTVNDLLDFSRITNEKFSLTKQAFHIEDIVRSCVELIEPQCHLKKIELSLRYDKLLPITGFNDPNRLRQVILNLLSNAVKFTLRGKIEVVALLASRNMLRINVQDSGIGIRADAQEKIFMIYGKLEGNEKLNPQGCGLGLSISNILVKSMGGSQIHLTSRPGKGSLFSFQIAISPEEENPEPGITSQDSTSDFEELLDKLALPEPKEHWREPVALPSILIADDSEFNRLVLLKMLETLGYRCDEAYTGLDAVNKVIHRETVDQPYATIFMDIEMPEISGIEATIELRKLAIAGKIKQMPIVVGCTAYVSQDDKENGLSSGMSFYLEKPISKADLVALVARHLLP